MAVDEEKLLSVIKTRLKRSKGDQLGKGVHVFLGRTGMDVCPVSLILQYITERGPSPGSFSGRQDGAPLTKAVFVTNARQALKTLGLDQQHYAGHSFRIGAIILLLYRYIHV